LPLDRAKGRFDQAARAVSAAAGALLLLCGCEGKPFQPGEIRIPPSLAERFYPPQGWAWGRLTVEGAPPLRYGVAAPGRAVRAEVLILPGAGEPVEAWFETADALVARGYGVWALDWAGQGGSARWWGAGDRLYALSLDPDVAALRQMIARVVRPGSRAPLILVGDGLGAQLALRALAGGLPDVEGAVLGAPALSARSTRLVQPFGDWGADIAGRVGFGRPFVAGEHSWRPPEHRAPGERADGRGGVADSWMQTNPDLRSGGASLAWTAAYNRSAAAARDPAALGRTKAPVLMLSETRDGAARNACYALKSCRFVALGDGGPPHLAADPVRGRWLSETARFIEVRARGHVVAAAPLRAP
jgi:lysophospholipase